MKRRQPFASDFLNPSPHYQRGNFHIGLERCGYRVGVPVLDKPEPEDVLLLWNRNSRYEEHALNYEKHGAKVIIAENGYIGKDKNGGQFYAIALWEHSGAGEWKEGPHERWADLGIELSPWRTEGHEIVILPQRGIGHQGVAMPRDWPMTVVEKLKKVTDRPIRVRPHPGAARTSPLSDLRNAWAGVTWGSGAGIKAVVGGVPMFCDFPRWIGAPAATCSLDDMENRFLDDRMPMLRRLAWAQWSSEEITSGEPFEWLLQ